VLGRGRCFPKIHRRPGFWTARDDFHPTGECGTRLLCFLEHSRLSALHESGGAAAKGRVGYAHSILTPLWPAVWRRSEAWMIFGPILGLCSEFLFSGISAFAVQKPYPRLLRLATLSFLVGVAFPSHGSLYRVQSDRLDGFLDHRYMTGPCRALSFYYFQRVCLFSPP